MFVLFSSLFREHDSVSYFQHEGFSRCYGETSGWMMIQVFIFTLAARKTCAYWMRKFAYLRLRELKCKSLRDRNKWISSPELCLRKVNISRGRISKISGCVAPFPGRPRSRSSRAGGEWGLAHAHAHLRTLSPQGHCTPRCTTAARAWCHRSLLD